MNSAVDAIVTVDVHGFITAWNPAAARIFGYTEAQAVGKPVTMLMPARYRAQHPSTMERFWAGEGGRVVGGVVELEGRRSDGGEFPIELSLARWDESGQSYVTAIIRDISKRRRAEDAQREGEARYRSLFEDNHAVMLLVDPETGAVEDANPAACAWYGWSRAELLAMRIDQINTLSRDEVRREMQKARTRERRAFRFRHRRADGTVSDVEVYSGPISVDGRLLLYSIVYDVTERARAEAALQQSEAMRDVAERVARVGSFRRTLDANAPRATWSEGMYPLFDVDPGTFDGDPVRVLDQRVHPDDREGVLRLAEAAAASGEPVPVELRVQHRDGSEHILHSEAALERDAAGEPCALTGYYQDVTEQRRAEEKIRRLDRLYATLSAVNRAIVHVRSRDDLFDAICRVAVDDGGFLMAWIGLVDETDGLVKPVASAGDEGGYLEQVKIASVDAEALGAGPTGRAIRENRCIICQDIAGDPRMAPWRAPALARGFRSSAAVPIILDAAVIGTFSVYSGDPAGFEAEEQSLLEEAGRDISFALESLRQAEVARQIEAMRATAEHAARIGSFRWELASRGSAWSPEVYELFDIRPGEFDGDLPQALGARVRPEDVQALRDAIDAVPELGELPPQEFRVVHRDGTERIVVGGGACEHDERGAATALVGYVQDVTEQRRAEAELREANDRFDLAQRAARAGVWDLDLRSGSFTWSPEMFELMGRDARTTEATFDVWRGCVHPDDVDRAWAGHQAALDDHAMLDLEYRVVTGDAEVRWINAIGHGEYDEQGTPVRMTGLCLDITERKRTEQELLENAERHQAMLRTTMDGFLLTDAEGLLLEVNDTYCSMSGYSAEELLGMHITDLEAAESPAETRARMERVIAHGADRFVSRHRSKDGGVFDVEISVQYRPADGGRFVAFLQDITERRHVERLMGVPSEILAIMSRSHPVPETAQDIVEALKNAAGFDAVAVRLQEGEDYPFIAATGYSDDFLQAENSLLFAYPDGGLHRNEDGSVSLDCTCGLVLSGASGDADPVVAPSGSAWTNDSLSLLDIAEAEDTRLRPRNRCIHSGFRSIALIPLRAGDRILGLLHLADQRPGRFTPESISFFEGLGASIGVALLRRQAEEVVTESERELRVQLSDTIKAMGAIVGMRDPYTAAHEQRVTHLAVAMAAELGLDGERLQGLVFAGEVHDIGKIAVPAEILTKPAALSDIEFVLVRQHAETGRDILATIQFKQPVATIVAQHHERQDGSGYPDGLAGDEIMLESRILAVADVVEAMASHRPYRPGLGIEAALAEVRSGAGSRYDADVVAACDRVFEQGFAFPEA